MFSWGIRFYLSLFLDLILLMEARMESLRSASLRCRPENLTLNLDRTAVVCVDMQNAFIHKGGMFDLCGWPTEGGRAVIEPSRRIIASARAAGVKVVFVKMSYNPGLTNAGGPDSPNYYKEIGMIMLRQHPELADKAIIQGTWGEEIIDELKPLPEEAVVRKQRYSGFAGTNLDLVLKTAGVKHCIFVGGATNVCVGHTLMDAFSHDYFPILVSDAVFTQCPPVTVEATCWTVENIFGWVAKTEDVLQAFAAGVSRKEASASGL
jgi:ureidoacrylate peracid hydrolase